MTRTRSLVRSRCQFLAADAASGALVGFFGTALWSVPPAPDDPYQSAVTRLQLQHLLIDRGLSMGAFDPAAVANLLEADRVAQPAGQTRACFQVIETGGAPALASHLHDEFVLGVKEGLICQVFFRLSGSMIDPDSYNYGDDPRTSIMVGISGLGGEYNRSTSRAAPDSLGERHGYPYDPERVTDGRTVVSFDGFRDEPSPGMRVSEVQATLAAATSLRPRPSVAAAGDNYAVELESPQHLAAAALMLGVLGLRRLPPSESSAPWSPFGWGSLDYGPIDPAARSWDRPVRGLSWKDTWSRPLRGPRGIA